MTKPKLFRKGDRIAYPEHRRRVFRVVRRCRVKHWSGGTAGYFYKCVLAEEPDSLDPMKVILVDHSPRLVRA